MVEGGNVPGKHVQDPLTCASRHAAGHPDVVGDTVYTTMILRPVLLLEIRPSGLAHKGMTIQ